MGWDFYAWSHPVLLMPHAVMWDYGLWRMPCAWWRMCPFLLSNPPPMTEWSPEGCPAFLPSPTAMFTSLLHQGKGCQSVGNLFVHKLSLKRKHCKNVGKTKTSCKGVKTFTTLSATEAYYTMPLTGRKGWVRKIISNYDILQEDKNDNKPHLKLMELGCNIIIPSTIRILSQVHDILHFS